MAVMNLNHLTGHDRQGSGQGIAVGFGSTDGLPFTCDDDTDTVLVLIQAFGSPFRGGLASAAAHVFLEGTDRQGTDTFGSVTEGPRTVRIAGGCVFTRGC